MSNLTKKTTHALVDTNLSSVTLLSTFCNEKYPTIPNAESKAPAIGTIVEESEFVGFKVSFISSSFTGIFVSLTILLDPSCEIVSLADALAFLCLAVALIVTYVCIYVMTQYLDEPKKEYYFLSSKHKV